MMRSEAVRAMGHRLARAVSWGLLAAAMLACGCGSEPAAMSSPHDTPSATVTVLPTPTPEPDVSTLPLLTPVDVLNRTAGPYVWNPVLFGDTVAFVEADSAQGPLPQDLPQQTSIKVCSIVDGSTSEIAAVPTPDFGSGWTWPPTALLSLPQRQGAPACLFWATAHPDYFGNGIPRRAGLWGIAGTTRPQVVVSEDVLLLPPSVSGDFVVLPVSSPEFEEKHGGNVGTTLGERLLLLCSVDAEPMPVDPISPRLPAEALGELSPYVSWFSFYRQGSEYLRTDLPGTPPQIFDLRTGVSLDIQVENPEDRDHPVEVQVAGTRAAWLVGSGDRSSGTIYLADLEGLTAEAVVRVEAPDMELMDWALSEHWLVWIDAGGRCLHAVHLPDMESAVVRGVVGESERAQVQVSGDVVLLDVRYPSPSMAVNLRAHAGALRVVRLPSAAETSTR